MDKHWKSWVINSLKADKGSLQAKLSSAENRAAIPNEVRQKLLSVYRCQIELLESELKSLSSEKSPSPEDKQAKMESSPKE